MSDLPRLWYTAGTNAELWGTRGTYSAIPYEHLPPVGLDGTFAYLDADTGSTYGMPFGDDEETPSERRAALDRLAGAANKLGLVVPPSFITFITDLELHTRVPSCTACYFELGGRLVDVPHGDPRARLLRFMNDQQTVLLWYLLLEPDRTHRVVCARPDWGETGGDTLEDAATPRDPVICAESFDEFLKRWWIENALWFAVNKGRAIEGELRTYRDAAAATRTT